MKDPEGEVLFAWLRVGRDEAGDVRAILDAHRLTVIPPLAA